MVPVPGDNCESGFRHHFVTALEPRSMNGQGVATEVLVFRKPVHADTAAWGYSDRTGHIEPVDSSGPRVRLIRASSYLNARLGMTARCQAPPRSKAPSKQGVGSESAPGVSSATVPSLATRRGILGDW
jgi:hypothetical protein